MSLAYYNENDPYAAQWLRNLIDDGQLPYGDVDERDIRLVRGADLRLYGHCHFFAGVGGWALGLGLAGWPADREVWTGSCPCQPFSTAGKRKGFADERHLWPEWFRLIRERRPATILGEQVGGAIGRGWLDAVLAGLEGEDYACGAAVLPACSVGAPHIRQRLWFVANAQGGTAHSNVRGGVARNGASSSELAHGSAGLRGLSGLVAISPGQRRGAQPQRPAGTDGRPAQEPRRLRDAGELGDASQPGLSLRERQDVSGPRRRQEGRATEQPGGSSADGLGDTTRRGTPAAQQPGQIRSAEQTSPWSDCDWLPCTDGKARPVEPGLHPLAHGVQCRAPKLRAYGNAIVPQAAAAFVVAAMDTIG